MKNTGKRIFRQAVLALAVVVPMAGCAPSVCADTPAEIFMTIGSTAACSHWGVVAR